jgi:hypothetical protein
MELLKDKLFNGVSFEILKEEYREEYSYPFIGERTLTRSKTSLPHRTTLRT